MNHNRTERKPNPAAPDTTALLNGVSVPRGRELPAPLPPRSRVDKQLWNSFVYSDDTKSPSIQSNLTASWQRCLQLGVDPAQKGCDIFLPQKTFSPEQQFLHELGATITPELLSYLEEKELIFTLADPECYIVNTVGAKKTLSRACNMDFNVGANWSEQSVGTNAIGTAIANGLPQSIVGVEHFCESHHGWICSAAPVFGIGGELRGCVNISGLKEADHRRSLALAIHYARAIEALLFQRHCMGMLGQILDKTAVGLLTLDTRGEISSCNPIAAHLLHHSADELFGRSAREWFDLSPLENRLQQPTPNTAVPLQCLHNPTLEVFATPVLNNSSTLHGISLCIVPPAATAGKTTPRLPKNAFDTLIGDCTAMRKVVKKAGCVAAKKATVLLTGESGTGKEVMVRALHAASPWSNKPFVAVNCGAIAADLIQSELFGYVDGAFTGAKRGGQPGKFEQANGGTLFLDEIGEMPLAMQVNLLRVLDEKKVVRVGGREAVPLNLRIVAATNRDLEAMVDEGTFRQDLFYRLSVVSLELPPLRERENDMTLLANHFIRLFAREMELQVDEVEPEFYQALAAHTWPGNVRELRHVIESSLILMEENRLERELLPRKIRRITAQPMLEQRDSRAQFSSLNFNEIQKQALQQALRQFDGNISQMAKALGIGRNTTYAKLKKFNLLQEGAR